MHIRAHWIATIVEEKMIMGILLSLDKCYKIKLSDSEWSRFQKDNRIKVDGVWVYDYNGERNGGSLFLDFYGCKLIEGETDTYTAEYWERKPYTEGELDSL